jgi:tRNA-modifying protein YgfZ
MIFRLNRLSVVDVVGKESDKILHNLTTNHVRALEVAAGCETFVTEVRGKILGHVLAYRNETGYRLIGAAGQSEKIVAHVDRYTIREDAHASVEDDKWCGFVVSSDLNSKLAWLQTDDQEPLAFRHELTTVAGHCVDTYVVNWVGGTATLLLVPTEVSESVANELAQAVDPILGEAEFHRQRTIAAFPWYGIDLDENNLPQEADRDSETICFTKGCYLGQETIARLDALGQVQKKLVRWSMDAEAAPGTTLDADGKPIARLTSIAKASVVGDANGAFGESDPYVALAMTRRSHFASGSRASGVDSASGNAVHAVVL